MTRDRNIARISIVMSTYNRAGFLREALESMTQLNPPAYEIIVIDDGSTDETSRVLDEFASHIIFEKQRNAGKSCAINHAVGLANGDWIWICDDDDLVLPGAVATFSRGVEVDPDAGFVYSGCGWLVRDESGEFQQKFPPVIDLPKTEEIWGCLLAGEWIPSLCTLIMKRDIFLRVGGLQEKLRRVEDEDLALRLLRSNYGIPIVDKTYMVRQHDGVRGAGEFRFSNMNREMTDIAFLREIYRGVYDAFEIDDYRTVASNRYNLPAEPILLRLLTMFRVCLWENARNDFRLSAKHDLAPRDIANFSYSIALALGRFNCEKINEFLASRLIDELKDINEVNQLREPLLVGLIKGLYWLLVVDTRSFSLWSASKRVIQILYLLGIWSIARISQFKDKQ